MRLFTSGLTGLLSDQSASEIANALAEMGHDLDDDTVESRLSYLVEHGNLARSPRETEARSLTDYLRNRARYQLSQRGELVHRQVEELLGHSDAAREVSSEMLGGILAGLRALAAYDEATLAGTEPDVIALGIGTVFAQFDRLVHSTREFYTYLTQVLTRFDLDRASSRRSRRRSSTTSGGSSTRSSGTCRRSPRRSPRSSPGSLRCAIAPTAEPASSTSRGARRDGRRAWRRRTGSVCAPGSWASPVGAVTPTSSAPSPPRRCARCSPTCAGSPGRPSVSTADMPT